MSLHSIATHYVPWDGNIETGISAARAKSLSIKDTDEVSRNFQAQILKLTDAGVDFDSAQPAASGLIIRCANPQAAYDAVFGNMQQGAKVLSFSKAAIADVQADAGEMSSLRMSFGKSAARFNLGGEFAEAARKFIVDNINRPAPALMAA